MASTRKELLGSIADQVADYREGDVPRRTPDIVERWVRQFPDKEQDGILLELNHVLGECYISRNIMLKFLTGLMKSSELCGADPKEFWKQANILSIQQGGNSQRELLGVFGEILIHQHGLALTDCGSNGGPFIYIDDGLFGGGRVWQDIAQWVEHDAPKKCCLHIVVAVLHTGGEYFVKTRLDKLLAKTNKDIKVKYWRICTVENRKWKKNESDVLWPSAVPGGPLAEAYVHYMTQVEPKYALELRTPGSVGVLKFFSSDAGRIHLEQQFLAAGLEIRERCPNLSPTIRPLGATLLKTFGFGSTIVTFRNCANNCPPCLWAGDPWFPLFPRSTNTDAFMKRLFDTFKAGKGGKG